MSTSSTRVRRRKQDGASSKPKAHASAGPKVPTDPLLEDRATPLSLRSRILLIAGAVLATIAGLLGLVLPIIPGIPILAVALLLFARTMPSVRRAVNRLDKRLPVRARLLLRRWRDKRLKKMEESKQHAGAAPRAAKHKAA